MRGDEGNGVPIVAVGIKGARIFAAEKAVFQFAVLLRAAGESASAVPAAAGAVAARVHQAQAAVQPAKGKARARRKFGMDFLRVVFENIIPFFAGRGKGNGQKKMLGPVVRGRRNTTLQGSWEIAYKRRRGMQVNGSGQCFHPCHEEK